MADRRVMLLTVTLVTFVMVLSSLGLLAAGAQGPAAASAASTGASTASSASSAASAPARPATTVAPAGTDLSLPQTTASGTAPEGVNPAVALVQSLIAEKKLNPSSVFFPAAPPTTPRPAGSTLVSAYTSNPSPMGLSDIGLGSHGAYVYNSTSFEASIHLNSFTDYNPGYAGWTAPPNYMTWQLNTVTVNVSFPGSTTGVFWIQNVVHFNGTSLQFENNIWNMSSASAALTNHTLLHYNGTLVNHGFYYIYGPTYQVQYPFTLDLYNNMTTRGGHPGVYFNYTLTNTTTGPHTGSFDYVTFNGTTSPSHPPQFSVNGKYYNPFGTTPYLLYDTELIFGGNGGGANAVITNLSATATLQYWDKTSGTYANVPSAYDYGVDTGETADGVAAAYQGTTELLSQGPSQLYGLWNTSNSTWGPAAHSGWINVDLSGLPNYGFVFGSNQSSVNYIRGPTGNFSYAPSNATGVTVTHLPPPPSSDPYIFRAYANGHGWDNITVSDNATGTAAFTLAANARAFYTPVYLSTTAQVAAFGAAGLPGVTYSAVHNGLWVNSTDVTIGVPFNLLNDFRFPEFMLFAGEYLSVNVSLDRFIQNPSPILYYKYNSVRVTSYYEQLSQGYFFNYGTGNFTVTNTTVSGSAYLTYDASFTPLSSVEFWQTTNSRAGWITTNQDSFGVAVINSTYATLWNISGQGGANAIAVFSSEYVAAFNISSNGTDGGGGVPGITPFPTWAAYLELDTYVYIDGVTASNGSIWIFAVQDDAMELLNFRAVNDVVLNDAGPEYGFLALFEGTLDVVISNWASVNSSSMFPIVAAFVEVEGLSVNDFFASGVAPAGTLDPGSPVYAVSLNIPFGFYVSEEIFLTNLAVSYGADAILGEYVIDLTVNGISATEGSSGMILEEAENVTASNVSAPVGAIGVFVAEATNVSLGNVTAGSGSVAVYAELDLNVLIGNVNGTSASLGTAYFFNPALALASGAPAPIPNAAVVALENENETIANISSLNYAFGVAENYSSEGVSISNVTSWNGDVGVALNATDGATVSSVFAYGNVLGGLFLNTTATTVTASTFEGSSSYGVTVTGGSGFVAYGNNFVANNGASTDGTFNAANVQASVQLPSAQFTYLGIGNYWSDWGGTGSYTINGAVSDTAPLPAFVAYWLEIDETGLAAGTVWGFTLDTVDYSTSAPLVFIPSWSLGDPNLGYVVNPPNGYAPTPASGTIPYTGTNTTVTISFARALYNVTFQESGLPSGTLWSVTLNGTTLDNTTSGSSGSVTFSEYDGSYSYSIGAVTNYNAAPSSGTRVVSGSSVVVAIAFTHVPVPYLVTFTETGLTAGVSWQVTLGPNTESSTNDTIVFSEFNNSYIYTIPNEDGYTPTPSAGTVLVAGLDQNVNVVFSAAPVGTYVVTFEATGLTTGTNWSVTLSSTSGSATHYSGNTATVTFEEPNATYTYTINTVPGYKVEQESGTVQVAGGPQLVNVTFAPATYTITFTETGLATGTNWSVTIGTSTHNSTGTTVTFLEVDGTYNYQIGAVQGYSVTASTGSITLTGAATGATIAFTSTGPSSTSSSGLSTLDWALIGIVIAIIVIVLIVALAMRGRGGAAAGSETSTTTTTTESTTATPEPWSEETPPGSSP
jgi:hypothetical protein